MTLGKLPFVHPGEYVLVRSRDSGVHAGYYVDHNSEGEVSLTDSRRIWKATGINCISDLAIHGAAVPDECFFAVVLPKIVLMGCCEIIPCSEKARVMIQSCKEWRV